MDNASIARILSETASLMEIDGGDSFRIRSYRNAAEAIEALPQQVSDLVADPRKLLAIQGIGKGMVANLQELTQQGELSKHTELVAKYGAGMLELLKIQGLGPKTIALLWSAHQACSLDAVAQLAREGKIRELPRMGEKHEQKILKAIDDYRRIAGRFLIDDAEATARQLTAYLMQPPFGDGIEKITPAGSLRRGRETVGDLDILVTGPGCVTPPGRQKLIEHILQFPALADVLAKGDNKISFRVHTGLQVDVRLLAPESFGAAMCYFTGSKSHNVALRQRALRMGYTLNEYALAELAEDGTAGKPIASATEADIYAALKLPYIPPEMRENLGEIDAAEHGKLPELITLTDIRGDVHMHTTETDGKNSIAEMADAAIARGYQYIAITDHSKALAFANGLDDKRALEHIRRIRQVDAQTSAEAASSRQSGNKSDKPSGIRILAGIEVDILADGSLDLSDEVLAQMDLVIASVHSHFNQDRAQMTDRLLRALANPHVCILGHPTGRLQLRRAAYPVDMEQLLQAARQHKVAMELNSYPDRLDLNDVHLRMAREHGVKIVINTDSHHTSHMEKMSYGILQARRAWLTKDDVLNTLPADKFVAAVNKGW